MTSHTAAATTAGEKLAEQSDIVLECQRVGHAFGEHRVLFDINLKVARGQVVSLVGPSGCGKSTLLRAILGTHPPGEGSVLVNGTQVVGPSRDCGIVYQRYSLFPFLTALDNCAFGLMLDKTMPRERLPFLPKFRRLTKAFRAEAEALLIRMGLKAALDRYPAELSGGMCQRVAIAQALVMRPKVLLLDEPFGALDEATREDMQELLLQLSADNVQAKKAGQPPPYTIIIVTHELNEAIYVADRVLGLSQYWNWEETGQTSHPGATLVYDCVSPVFNRDAEDEAAQFVHQRAVLRKIVFDSQARHDRHTNVRFWDECAAGKGAGVMAP